MRHLSTLLSFRIQIHPQMCRKFPEKTKCLALRNSGSRHSVVASSTRRVSPRSETESSVTNDGGGEGGAGVGMSVADVERMHGQMRRDLEHELHVSEGLETSGLIAARQD